MTPDLKRWLYNSFPALKSETISDTSDFSLHTDTRYFPEDTQHLSCPDDRCRKPSCSLSIFRFLPSPEVLPVRTNKIPPSAATIHCFPANPEAELFRFHSEWRTAWPQTEAAFHFLPANILQEPVIFASHPHWHFLFPPQSVLKSHRRFYSLPDTYPQTPPLFPPLYPHFHFHQTDKLVEFHILSCFPQPNHPTEQLHPGFSSSPEVPPSGKTCAAQADPDNDSSGSW